MSRCRRLPWLSLVTGAWFCAACPSKDYVELYRAAAKAPSYSDADIKAQKYLGGRLVDKGTSFNVYSENATRIELLLFDNADADLPTRRVEMTRLGDVWSAYVQGVGVGQAYGYVAWGPNWPYVDSWRPGKLDGFVADVDDLGNRYNPNKLLFDPYSRAFNREHDWMRGSTASGPARKQSTWGAASKSVVVQESTAYAWSDSEKLYRDLRKNPDAPGHRPQDLIVYEVHVKGFSKNPGAWPNVLHPGTFRGFGEAADYFVSLGVTAVELLPVFEKPLDGGYWGYQTIGFFSPEMSYALEPAPDKLRDEFKWMVDELHKRDIEVILDVVYNHTGEGGLWREKIQAAGSYNLDMSQLGNFDPKEVAGLYSFRGLDNQAWYALPPDGQTYWNNSGVGNDLRCNNRPARKLIIDSLRYWVEEMHVDGYRFDLAPVLGEKDRDYNTWDDPKNTVLQDIIDDPVLRAYNTRVIAEPWSNSKFALAGFPTSTDGTIGWSEWNANFRDLWRSFLKDEGSNPDGSLQWAIGKRLNDEKNSDGSYKDTRGPYSVVDAGLTGSKMLFGWNGRRPYNSINFVTCHDGFTLYDLVTYNAKVNGCGPLNPICCTSPASTWCDATSGESNNRSRAWAECSGHTAAEWCQSIAGCAWVNDCWGCSYYCKGIDDSLTEAVKRQVMRNFFVGLMLSHGTPMLYGGDEWMRTQLGNNNAYTNGGDNAFNWFDWGAWEGSDERWRMFDFVSKVVKFRRAHSYAFAPAEYDVPSFAYKSYNNTDATDDDRLNTRRIMIHYYDATLGPELVVLINMQPERTPAQPGWGSVTFTLPTGRAWKRRIDTQLHFDLADTLAASSLDPKGSANVSLDSADVVGATYEAKARSIVVLEAN